MMRLWYSIAAIVITGGLAHANPVPAEDEIISECPIYFKKFYVDTSKSVTWHGALMACLRNNSELAAIENEEEFEEVKKAIHQTGLQREMFWVSGTDLGDEGRFLWASGGAPIAGPDTLFQRSWWLGGEPDNGEGQRHPENCVELLQPSLDQEYGLNDEDCLYKSYFVCQYFVPYREKENSVKEISADYID